jgi:hypothetical protein
MRERRKAFEGDDARIVSILEDGCARANATAEKTLALAKEACGLGFFGRTLAIG